MAYSMELPGRVALVTGASVGLGAQFAKTLSRAVGINHHDHQWDTPPGTQLEMLFNGAVRAADDGFGISPRKNDP